MRRPLTPIFVGLGVAAIFAWIVFKPDEQLPITRADGTYVLPDSYVGVAVDGSGHAYFEVDRQSAPQILGLDDPDRPRTITLPQQTGPSLDFVRQEANLTSAAPKPSPGGRASAR